jgi:hypothetical protein
MGLELPDPADLLDELLPEPLEVIVVLIKALPPDLLID